MCEYPSPNLIHLYLVVSLSSNHVVRQGPIDFDPSIFNLSCEQIFSQLRLNRVNQCTPHRREIFWFDPILQIFVKLQGICHWMWGRRILLFDASIRPILTLACFIPRSIKISVSSSMSGPSIPRALSIIWMKYVACLEKRSCFANSAIVRSSLKPKIPLASGSKSKSLFSWDMQIWRAAIMGTKIEKSMPNKEISWRRNFDRCLQVTHFVNKMTPVFLS